MNDPSNAGQAYFAWNPQNDNSWYPVSWPYFPGPEAVIDLNGLYQITNICIYWGTISFSAKWQFMKTNPFETSVVSPITTTISTSSGYTANKWNCNIKFTQSIIAQFIRLELQSSPQTSLLELVIYGNKQSDGIKSKNKYQGLYSRKNPTNNGQLPQTPLGLLMGTNGYGWSPWNNFTNCVGTVREYQDWQWTEGGTQAYYAGYPNNQNRFQCSAQGNFCLDDVYSNATKLGLNYHQVLMNTPNWFHAYNSSESNWKPVPDNVFTTTGATIDPKNYIAYADHAWQAAARYGRNKNISISQLKLAPNQSLWNPAIQPKLVGTGWLDWMEILNEPNCWWTNRQTWYSATEQAAIQSAAYDGHCGTLPNTVGVKQADPSMNVSFGALANDSTTGFTDRWQTLLWWSQNERSGKNGNKCFKEFPAEAVNVKFKFYQVQIAQQINIKSCYTDFIGALLCSESKFKQRNSSRGFQCD